MSLGRFARALLVVTGFGALAGAIVGVLGALAIMLVIGGDGRGPDLALVGAGAGIGAVLGGVMGPLLGFGMLRDVPLGLAILVTGLGALAGVAVSAVAGLAIVPLFGVSIGGMVLAALALRVVRSIRGRKRVAGGGSASTRDKLES